jgi:SAM-dependent methyltransferase
LILKAGGVPNEVPLDAIGFKDALAQPGWVLIPGTWIRASLPPGLVSSRIALCSAGQVLQEVDRKDWNALIYPKGESWDETCFQFEPTGAVVDGAVQLQLEIVLDSGQREAIARSAPGVLLASARQPMGLALHSLDVAESPGHSAASTRQRGTELVAACRARGEPVVVDLGCGFRKGGTIGIDATANNTTADLICLLGFDQLPFDDDSVDEVVCRDLLEHLPKAVFLESRRKLHYPVMHLIDEIWRVLKPNAVFRSWTPVYPHPELFQDPTHLSEWTMKSMDYFCGVYEGAKRIYGIKACFEKVEVREDGFYLFAELRKPA